MRALVVALLVCVAGVARVAHAESDDHTTYIVVVGTDPEFIQALESLMENSFTHVKAFDRATPALAELGPESRRLADANAAFATVWISPTSSGATLVTYSRTADRFVVREVPYKLPLDTTQAFETARMVRVMLRALDDKNDEAAVTNKIKLGSRPREPQLAASLGAGAWFAAPETTAAPMTTLSLAWRPYGLGATASATLAPSTDFETVSFQGDVRFMRFAVEAHKALRVAPTVRVTPSLGLSLHAVSLGGRFGAMGEPVSSDRYDPGFTVGTVVGIALPHRVEIGLALSADCLLQKQRYATGTEEILDVPRIQAMMAVRVGVRL